ncbi:MAG: TIGR02996 domain-containing protein [Archangiaceae bacterium]|nr:TIGR02996 domain-containing protein [Archangiaceae bacterium]
MLSIGASHEEEIDRLLSAANGRRTTRVLTRLQVLETVEEALRVGYALRTGGSVDDARAQSTLCLAVKTEKGVTVGIGAARGASPEPGQLWNLLDRWLPDGSAQSRQRAQSWARRVREKHVELPLDPARSHAPTRADAALLEAVLAEPDALERRRVYADLLQERGDPRGELISVQLMLEQLPEDDDRRIALGEREVILRSSLERSWREKFQDHVIHLEYRRGFVERATLHATALFHGVEALLETEPVRELRLIDLAPEDVPRLVLAPWIKRLTALELHHLNRRDRRRALNNEDVARLLDTDRLRGLTRLDFTGHMLDDTGLMIFSHHVPTALPRLTALTVSHDAITPVGVGVLVDHLWFQKLAALDLSSNHLGLGGTALVANAVSVLRLKALDLGSNLLGDEGARVLAGSGRLAGLDSLGLYANHIGPYGARALLDSPFLSQLKRLNLGGNRIGSVAAKRLSEKSSA